MVATRITLLVIEGNMAKFCLVYSPPTKRLARYHRLNPLIRFARLPWWTRAEVKRIETLLDRLEGKPCDTIYLASIGESEDFLDQLTRQVREYMALVDRQPFPTAQQIRQLELRPVRESRNLRWW